MPGLFSTRTRPRGRRISLPAFYLLLSAVFLVAIIKLSGPLTVIRRQHEELARLRVDKAHLLAEKARLQGYQHDLATDRGLERAIRRDGYIRAGERRLVFIPAKPETPPASREDREAPRTP